MERETHQPGKFTSSFTAERPQFRFSDPQSHACRSISQAGSAASQIKKRMAKSRANQKPPARFLGRAAGRITDEFFRNKACRFGRNGKGPSCHANRHQTVHGGFNLMQRDRPRLIGNRPSFQQPVPYLLDRAEFLDIPVRRHHKGKGSPPVNFDQRDVFLDRRMRQAHAHIILDKEEPPSGGLRSPHSSLMFRRERDLWLIHDRCDHAQGRTTLPGRHQDRESRHVPVRSHGQKRPSIRSPAR